MCLEALSRGSSPSAWQAAYTMESILLLVPALALLRPSPWLCCTFQWIVQACTALTNIISAMSRFPFSVFRFPFFFPPKSSAATPHRAMWQVINNMVCCERVLVRTPTGPGGISGPARLGLTLYLPCSRRVRTSLHWQLAGRRDVPCMSAHALRALLCVACWWLAFQDYGVILAGLAHARICKLSASER